MCSTFGALANLLGRPHYKVEEPEEEVRPWAQQAADLLESIPAAAADRALKIGGIASVLIGLGGMVMARVSEDRRIAQRLMAEMERQAREAGVPPAGDGAATAADPSDAPRDTVVPPMAFVDPAQPPISVMRRFTADGVV